MAERRPIHELDPAPDVLPTDNVVVQRGTDPAQRATVSQLPFGTAQADPDAEAAEHRALIERAYLIAQAV